MPCYDVADWLNAEFDLDQLNKVIAGLEDLFNQSHNIEYLKLAVFLVSNVPKLKDFKVDHYTCTILFHNAKRELSSVAQLANEQVVLAKCEFMLHYLAHHKKIQQEEKKEHLQLVRSRLAALPHAAEDGSIASLIQCLVEQKALVPGQVVSNRLACPFCHVKQCFNMSAAQVTRLKCANNHVSGTHAACLLFF